MSQTFRAHFDGNVIVPDEPIELPVDEPLDVAARPRSIIEQRPLEQRRAHLLKVTGHVHGLSIPADAFRRENLYEDRQ